MSKCARYSRYLLFILNLALLLSALALIAVGLWMRYDDSFDSDLKNIIYKYNDPQPLHDSKFNIRVWILVIYWVITGFAIFGAIISFIGFFTVITHRKGSAIAYLIIFVISIILQIGCGIYLWIQRKQQIFDLVKKFVFDEYTTERGDNTEVLKLQNLYNCCGYDDLQGTCRGVNLPNCTNSIFNTVDNVMMISGIILAAILILELLMILLTSPILFGPKRHEKRTLITHIGHF